MTLSRSPETQRVVARQINVCGLLVGLAILLAWNVATSAQMHEPKLATDRSAATQTLAPLIKRVAPSVVTVVVNGRIAQERNPLLNDPFLQHFFEASDASDRREAGAAGSGVIIDADQGIIVTNHHIIEHAETISVALRDGRRFEAKRVGSDPDTDLAIIRVGAEGLVAIPFGNSAELEVGDYVLAVGNPLGRGQTVSQGIVGALRRSGFGIRGYEDFIQTSTPMNSGNSGGPLVNLSGELVGINTDIAGAAAVNAGVGFAVPSNLIRESIDQLIKYGAIRRGRPTIAAQDLTPALARTMGLPANQAGAVITTVEAASAAARAGLKSGDVITAIDNTPVRTAFDLRNKIEVLHLGDVVELGVLRGGQATIVRAEVTTPGRPNVWGGQVNLLLEGATFGPATIDPPLKGVELVSLQAGSRAARAGLRRGDIVTSVNQKKVEGLDEFALLAKARTNALTLAIIRDGQTILTILH